MKKFKIKVLVVMILLIGVVISCTTQKTGNKKINITGNWLWMESMGGIAGVTRTPESTGKIMNLQITKDSIHYYENGELKNSVPYKLSYGKLMLSNEPSWYIGDSMSKTGITRRDSLLILTEDCFDCFTHKYSKMKEK